MIMKPKFFLFFIFVILSIVLSGCEELDQFIDAEILDEEPDEYINITEEQMNDFPHLKEAIQSDTYVKTPRDEYLALDNFLSEIRNIKYDNKFYKVGFIT